MRNNNITLSYTYVYFTYGCTYIYNIYYIILSHLANIILLNVQYIDDLCNIHKRV